MYAPLVKQLNLTPEEADKFYNTIVDYGLKTLQAVQSGKSNEQGLAANGQSLETDLRALLGDDRFGQYQNYMKNDMADQTLLLGDEQ